MRAISAKSAASGIHPVGLFGAFSINRRAPGAAAARNRSRSSVQSNPAASNWTVATSAPAARATSCSDWYAGSTATARAPGEARTPERMKIASSAPANTRTSSASRPSYIAAISARSSGWPADSV